MILGALIALIIAIFIAKDANSRGMVGIGWGIGVFAMLIIFLPIYLMVRKPKLTE